MGCSFRKLRVADLQQRLFAPEWIEVGVLQSVVAAVVDGVVAGEEQHDAFAVARQSHLVATLTVEVGRQQRGLVALPEGLLSQGVDHVEVGPVAELQFLAQVEAVAQRVVERVVLGQSAPCCCQRVVVAGGESGPRAGVHAHFEFRPAIDEAYGLILRLRSLLDRRDGLGLRSRRGRRHHILDGHGPRLYRFVAVLLGQDDGRDGLVLGPWHSGLGVESFPRPLHGLGILLIGSAAEVVKLLLRPLRESVESLARVVVLCLRAAHHAQAQ